MPKSINYGQLMHKAFRQVMSDVLRQVAKDGLPGEHHFYITFDTTHPGVDMSSGLKRRYPDDMTVVLQEWFEDLAVMPDRFSVTLSFGDVPERIVVPFEAVRTFVDPSVGLGLKFDAKDEAGGDEFPFSVEQADAAPASRSAAKKSDRDAEVVSLDTFRKH